MTAEILSPAMIAVLETLAAGDQPDGRSWRAVSALERRGLLTLNGAGTARITLAGTEALDDAEDADEPECEGHPAGPFDPMGETTYCDGSCA